MREKQCSKCKKLLPLDCFTKDIYQKSGLRPSCKECRKQKGQKYYLENKEKINRRQKKYRTANKDKERLRGKIWYRENSDRKKGYSSKYFEEVKRNCDYKRKFNITLDDYDKMFKEQDGVCGICGLPQIMRRLAVDHDHKTGKIRGLLCSGCNTSIGRLQDNPERLVKMMQYLQKYNVGAPKCR